MRATEVYECRTSSLRKFVYQLTGAAHPEIPYLGVDDVDGEEMEGGVSRIIVKYAGYDSGSAGAGGFTETKIVRRSVSREPIETNPKLQLDKDEKTLYGKIWDKWTKEGKVDGSFYLGLDANDKGAFLAYYKMKGTEAYNEPTCEFVRTTVFNYKSGFARNLAIGKIGNLPPGFPKYAERNALFLGHEEEQEGFATRIVECWQLSGPAKWDGYIYGKNPRPDGVTELLAS